MTYTASAASLQLVRGDAKITVSFSVYDYNGSVFPLYGVTEAKLQMALPYSGTNKINGTMTITDVANGKLRYTFLAVDLDAEGDYDAHIQLTYASGAIITAIGGTIKVLHDLPRGV
jgi:hypothetical protein